VQARASVKGCARRRCVAAAGVVVACSTTATHGICRKGLCFGCVTANRPAPN